jgi:poly(A) polymerase
MVDFENDYQPKNAAPPLITGYDLINEFGLMPSPLFKKILNFVEIERLSRSAMTRQEAVKMVRRLLREQSST